MNSTQLLLILLYLNFACPLFSQHKTQGRILNAQTKQALAFVNITINNSQEGFVSDIEGNFEYESSKEIFKLNFTYVGFEPQVYEGNNFEGLTILLKPQTHVLEEISVFAGENPAHRIIRQAIKNRKYNNPEKLSAFRYNSYNKFVVTAEEVNVDSTSLDSLILYHFKHNPANKDLVLAQLADTTILRVLKPSIVKSLKEDEEAYRFLMESVTEKKYIAPNLYKETVLANRVSGLKDPFFTSVATSFQPFTFYKNRLTLLDKDYLNPISKESLTQYFFSIEDTLIVQKDSVYIIAFEPKPNKTFEGLKGAVYINTNQFAIQNIMASSADTNARMSFEIQQQYQYVDDKQWFPAQLHAKIYFNEFTDLLAQRTMIVSESYIQNIELNPQLQRRVFDEVTLEIDSKANSMGRDSLFWLKYKPKPMSIKEYNTYHILDSVGREVKADEKLAVMNSVNTGRISWGLIDLVLNKLVRINRYEALRLGMGLSTNPRFSKKLQLEGYFAYGIRDAQWKYGFSVDMDLTRKGDFHVGVLYQNDILESGRVEFLGKTVLKQGNYFRNFLMEKADNYEFLQPYLTFRPWANSQLKASLNLQSFQPNYQYRFLNENQDISQHTGFQNTELALQFHYAKAEKYMSIKGYKKLLSSKMPILELNYKRGFSEVFEGDFEYEKWEGKLTFEFYLRKLGKTTTQIQAGHIFGNSLPYTLLYNGRGVQSTIPVFSESFFQTMGIYEFTSDRFINVFWTHNFGKLFPRGISKNIQPELSVIHSMAWGNLDNITAHQHININTLEKGFVESGLKLDKLYRLNFDLINLNLGIGIFYRYGAYSFPTWQENTAWQLTTSFSF